MQFPEFKAADVTCFHSIRDVAPQVHMYSTSFRLPEQVALAEVPTQKIFEVTAEGFTEAKAANQAASEEVKDPEDSDEFQQHQMPQKRRKMK